MKQCTECGNWQVSENNFCNECGKDIKDIPDYCCVECKKRISTNSKFCEYCGHEVGEPPTNKGGE